MSTGTWASVTEIPCTCKSLENSAADPNQPITYDPELNEYNIVNAAGTEGHISIRIYHCPFCGGLAPESKREKLFAVVPHDEYERLRSLTTGIGSITDALRILGTPTTDEPIKYPEGCVWPVERDGKLPVRALTFTGLSDVADVQVMLRDDNTIQVTFGPKYVGPVTKSGLTTQ